MQCTPLAVAVWMAMALTAHGQYVSTKTLGILRFSQAGADAENEWIGIALQSAIHNDIQATQRIRLALTGDPSLHAAAKTPEQRAELGLALGASHLILGSYSVVQKRLIVDIEVFDVEAQSAKGQARVEGELSTWPVLQKRLTLKAIETAGITLKDEDKILLFQFESESLDALRKNYQGLLALERGQSIQAKKLFQEAAEKDPYYKAARDNLEASKKVDGKALLAGAQGELQKKDLQMQAFVEAFKTLQKDLYTWEIKGEPKVITRGNDKSVVDLEIEYTVKLNPEAMQSFLKAVDKLRIGGSLYPETDLLFRRLYHEGQYYGHDIGYIFACIKSISIRSNDLVIMSRKCYVNSRSRIDKNGRMIFGLQTGEGFRDYNLFNEDVNPRHGTVRFTDVPTVEVDKISSIDIAPVDVDWIAEVRKQFGE